MLKEVPTRSVRPGVQNELWARAAGRCQFRKCNRILYKSPVTQERVNISEKAHIYAFSEHGPRGWGQLRSNKKALNEIGNLLLVCHDCHKVIDSENNGDRYTAQLLRKWKFEHENRICVVTGIDPEKKSHVILYGANIGSSSTCFVQAEQANWALFPDWFPAQEKPIWLSMSWEGRDDDPEYWAIQTKDLKASFDRQINPLIKEGCHFSIFGFAPIPLLIHLGELFTDKPAAEVYQLQREPKQSWCWQQDGGEIDFIVNRPSAYVEPPVLAIALSSHIAHERITSVLGPNVTIWELTVEKPHNDLIKCRKHLSGFRNAIRTLIVEIAHAHGITTPLRIFPSMPVSTAVELGRTRMPKPDMPLIIYDQNSKQGGFIEALRIGAEIE